MLISDAEEVGILEQSLRILLADDHPIVRKGLKMSIEEQEDMEIVAEVGDGEAALQQIKKHAPDFAVVDIDMPKLDGLEVARQVRALSLPTRMIVLTLHTEVEFFQAAFDAGCHGYVLKDSAIEDIASAIRAVLEGQMYISPGMTRHLIEDRKAKAVPQAAGVLDSLTPSERKIMRHIGEGKSSKEIADEVGIHYRTVENHRTNICRKLGLEGANALVRFALQNQGKL